MTHDRRFRIAIYDLDRTITSIPTWTPFLLQAAWALAPWRLALIPVTGVSALGRVIGFHDRDRLKEIMHGLLLGPAVDPQTLAMVVERFADRMIREHIQPGARLRMAMDIDEGRRIVIATAAHRFYAEAIAQRLGVADLVATEASRDQSGSILAALSGANCYGAAKQRMIAQWLDDQGIDRNDAHIRFYSDHISDVPTFEWVDEAVVIDGGRGLLTLARERGWSCETWRAD